MNFEQKYSGWAALGVDRRVGVHRLLACVECLVGETDAPVDLLLDTASLWCVLREDPETLAGAEPLEEDVVLSTRFGLIHGALVRITLRVLATQGDDLSTEATFFVSADWPGPPVIGWKAALERFRFAVDSAEERFYFRA